MYFNGTADELAEVLLLFFAYINILIYTVILWNIAKYKQKFICINSGFCFSARVDPR